VAKPPCLFLIYFFGFGGLLPLSPPDGFPVVLGALTGFVVFDIVKCFWVNAYWFAFQLSHHKF
jgi:hypothetical protein